MAFTDFNFDLLIIENLRNNGFEKPTPVQNKVIPSIILGKDVIVSAQTGTGKTASYALPIINRLLSNIRYYIFYVSREYECIRSNNRRKRIYHQQDD